MKPIKIVSFVIFLFCNTLYSQGSGDTNITLYGNIAPQLEKEEDYLSIYAQSRIDQGKNGVSSIAPYLCLATNINEQLDFQLWISSKQATGDLTSGFSLGDLSFIGAYHFSDAYFDQTIDFGLISSTSGGKGLKKTDGKYYYTYPMEYQSTLGTIDVYAGYTIKTEIFNFSVGYQMPITSKNQNNFYPRYFDVDGDGVIENFDENFPPSNEMKRSSNFYSRAGYFIKNESDFIVNVGITAFYKFANDKFYDANTYDYGYDLGYNEVEGTKGIALNGVIQANYKIYEEVEISLYAGLPLIDRKEYIDGLMRTYFITPGFKYSF